MTQEDEQSQRRIDIKPTDIPFATTGLNAPTFYVEDIRGMMISQGMAKINLVDYRVDAINDDVKCIHIATIILPAHKVKSFGEHLIRHAPKGTEEGNGDAT